jgi:glyoxylase-like metal-dependent hydrolase (beta-lactamase superfamily II)
MGRPEPGAEPAPWQELAAGVYVCLAEPAAVNLGLIVGSESALIVDTGSSPAQGRLLRAAAGSVTEAPVTAAGITHWHYDHCFGLAGFAELQTFAHESVRERLLAPDARRVAADLGVNADELALPSRDIAVAAGLDLGGRRVELAHLGRGHTDGDLVVVVPDADVVFAGDLIESVGGPWYGADSYPHEWATTLDSLIGLMTGRTVAVPGHGQPVDREFVFEQRGRVGAVSAEIRRLAESGVPETEAINAGSWAFPAAHVAEGIRPGYGQLIADGRRSLPLI